MYLSNALSKGQTAVDNLDLDIRSGDRLGIIGRNGAGKSTLLHILAGLSTATAGRLDVTGKVTAVLTLGVGLREELSGRENIYLDGEVQGKNRAEMDQIVGEIIAFADIGDFIERPIRTYSTGMKARLAFSMIAFIDPEILIIDEALSVGDAAFSAKATHRIREICAKGKIVIIVSHSMQAIREICNRCIWMEAGKIVKDGMPEEVTDAYLESVRVADEFKLREKFRQLTGSRTYKEGFSVASVDLLTDNSSTPRSMIEVGRAMKIVIAATAVLDTQELTIRAVITRLDDLVMFDEAFDAAAYTMPDGSLGLEVEMTPMALGATVYRLDISLVSGAKIYADHTRVFETYTLNAPSGGKPMLLYPATAVTSSL